MSATARGAGLTRLQHLVLWVSNVERSVRFYCDVVGFAVKRRYPNAAFLIIPGTSDDHHLGLFEQAGAPRPDERVARMYHSAWEVGDLRDLARARDRLVEAGALVGSSNHGVSLSLYAKDPDGLEFEIFWTVPGGTSARTTELDLDGEMARPRITLMRDRAPSFLNSHLFAVFRKHPPSRLGWHRLHHG